MGKPYPNQRKKRPGRRPPHHYRGGYVRPNSLQDFGAKHVYDWIFPDVRGRDRRKLLNGFSAWFSIAMGLIGVAVGWNIAGPVGALLGFGGGLAFGEHLARKHRFHRP